MLKPLATLAALSTFSLLGGAGACDEENGTVCTVAYCPPGQAEKEVAFIGDDGRVQTFGLSGGDGKIGIWVDDEPEATCPHCGSKISSGRKKGKGMMRFGVAPRAHGQAIMIGPDGTPQTFAFDPKGSHDFSFGPDGIDVDALRKQAEAHVREWTSKTRSGKRPTMEWFSHGDDDDEGHGKRKRSRTIVIPDGKHGKGHANIFDRDDNVAFFGDSGGKIKIQLGDGNTKVIDLGDILKKGVKIDLEDLGARMEAFEFDMEDFDFDFDFDLEEILEDKIELHRGKHGKNTFLFEGKGSSDSPFGGKIIIEHDGARKVIELGGDHADESDDGEGTYELWVDSSDDDEGEEDVKFLPLRGGHDDDDDHDSDGLDRRLEDLQKRIDRLEKMLERALRQIDR